MVAFFRAQRTGVTRDDQAGFRSVGALGKCGQQGILFDLRQLSSAELEMHHWKLTIIHGLCGPFLAGGLAVVEGAGEDESLLVGQAHSLAQQGQTFLANLPGHKEGSVQEQAEGQYADQV